MHSASNGGFHYMYASEELEAVAQSYKDNHGNKAAAARAMGLPNRSYGRRLEEAYAKGHLGFESPYPGPGFSANAINVTLDKNDQVKSKSIKTSRDHQQGEPWTGLTANEVLKARTVQVRNGFIEREWFKPVHDPLHPGVLIQIFKDFLGEYKDAWKATTLLTPTEFIAQDWVAVYPLADWHIGLMAWAKENGGKNWDLKIARKTILNVMRDVIAETKPAKEAVIVSTGDLMHFSSYEPTTSRSKNVLDADGRYPKVLRTALEMMVDVIHMALTKHEKVTVRILQGNHDDEPSVGLQLALEMRFLSDPRVHVIAEDDSNVDRTWAVRYGKVLLGFNHGDMKKVKDQPLNLMHDYKKDFSKSELQVIYTGHLHNELVWEEQGILVKQLRAPIARDAYHHFHKWRSGTTLYSDCYNIKTCARLGVALPV